MKPPNATEDRGATVALFLCAGAAWRLDARRRAGAGRAGLRRSRSRLHSLLPIRRLALRFGQHADAPALYLAWPGLRARCFAQHHARVGRDAYGYAAPAFGYRGRLRVSAEGAMVHYPRLFERLRASARRDLP